MYRYYLKDANENLALCCTVIGLSYLGVQWYGNKGPENEYRLQKAKVVNDYRSLERDGTRPIL